MVSPRKPVAVLAREICALEARIREAEERRASLERRNAESPPHPPRVRLMVGVVALIGLVGGPLAREMVTRAMHWAAEWPCEVGAMPADTTITLERTACFGTCPVYTVTIHADGRVDFDGKMYVAHKGHASGVIPTDTVRSIFDAASRACIWKMRDRYEYPVSDSAAAITTLTAGGRTKRVKDYPAGSADAPQDPSCAPRRLTLLEGQIDRLADAWVGHDQLE